MRNPQVRNSKLEVSLYQPAATFFLPGISFSFPEFFLILKGGVTLK